MHAGGARHADERTTAGACRSAACDIVNAVPPGAAFDEHQSAWADYTASPWARLRYAVVAKTLTESLARLGPRLRIIDVGGGDALDSLPLAAAGTTLRCWTQQSRCWRPPAIEQ